MNYIKFDQRVLSTNWYFDENIKKIKTPFFCTFQNSRGKRCLGIVVNPIVKGKHDWEYTLIQLTPQVNQKWGNMIDYNINLETLIKTNKISIFPIEIIDKRQNYWQYEYKEYIPETGGVNLC